jgi:Xaa-Pro dipeptidase
MLTPQGCLGRQNRFRQQLAQQKIDAAIVTDPRDIYYLTGRLIGDIFRPPACLFIDHQSGWLVAPGTGDAHGVEVVPYEVNSQGTMHPDWQARATNLVLSRLARHGIDRIGCQWESLSASLYDALKQSPGPNEWIDIEPTLIEMQRHKDTDELALIRDAIRIDIAAYEAVRQTIRPGVAELEVLQAARTAANLAAGERVVHDGDYQCNSMGGWGRNRPIEAGEMYVVDAWVQFRGYWADTCRTFSVDDRPTDEQVSVFKHVAAAHQKITPMFTPGRRGTEICRALDAHLREHPLLREKGLVHHAGHGTGVRVHMEPDLNPDREGVLRDGDFVCFEPAGYVPERKIFVRLESVYRVTPRGPENLMDYPFELLRNA